MQRFTADALKVIGIVFALRSLMLVLDHPIIFIPGVDEILTLLWSQVGTLARSLFNAPWMPRFHSN